MMVGPWPVLARITTRLAVGEAVRDDLLTRWDSQVEEVDSRLEDLVSPYRLDYTE